MTAPNVLLVCVDHWPAYLMNAAGHHSILTPTLDQLAGGDRGHADLRDKLAAEMITHFYNDDLKWVETGRLVALPDKTYQPKPNRTLFAQRGWRFM